jgi:rubrerythrin
MTNREAVIWLINVTADIGKTEHSDLWHYEQALSEIKEMLESQPERKNGKWKHHMSFGVCLNCGYEYNWTGTDAKNFCPNCGADMRENTDE